MPHDRDDWQRRIKAVEREHATIRLAAGRLLEAFDRDPGAVGKALRRPDILIASKHLEGTYIIRLFAEFETGLRSFWSSSRTTEPPTHGLIDGIASGRSIPGHERTAAHAVREYRNALVHQRDGDITPFSIHEARSRLCRFFARLPRSW